MVSSGEALHFVNEKEQKDSVVQWNALPDHFTSCYLVTDSEMAPPAKLSLISARANQNIIN